MKSSNSTSYRRRATALCFIVLTLASPSLVRAQTIFTANGISAGSNGVAHANVTANNPDPLYNNTGPTTNNIQAVTFGNGFTMAPSDNTFGAYDNSFIIGGTITGSAIAASTSLPISYNFTLSKPDTVAISSTVAWTLTFVDSVNTTPQVIASGSLLSSDLSTTFVGNGNNYTFTAGVSSGASFTTTLELTYFGNITIDPPMVNGTMLNTGFDQQGITLNASAIPEPSTYAAIFGAVALAGAGWQRRRNRPASA